jgi:tellurite resistance protein TerC
VPAAFAVTREPFVIVAANVFAVLGLRPMFDLLIVALERLEQLAKALGALLGLIGVALCLEPVWTVPEWVLLLAVFGCLGGGVLASLTCPREPTDAVAGRSQ